MPRASSREAARPRAALLFASAAAPAAVTGATVAELQLIRALGESERWGGLRVYCQAPADLPAPRSVSRLPISALPELVSDPPDAAFVPYTLMAQLAHLRDQSERPFPILGYVHSLANLDAKGGIGRNLASPNHARDVALCASRSAATALASMLDDIVEGSGSGTCERPRIVECPLGCDLDVTAADRAAERNLHGWPDDAFVFLVVGRLDPTSKMDLLPLLVAFARAVAASDRDLRLAIVGQEQFGGYRELLGARAAELGIADRVTLREPNGRADVVSALAAADGFVSPSDHLQETFGLTLIEALQAGLPIIASDWNGYRDILAGTGAAVLVPTLRAPAGEGFAATFGYGGRAARLRLAQTTAIDLDVLSQAMVAIAADEQRAAAMARAARAAGEIYRWPAVTARLADIAEEASNVLGDWVRTRGLPAFRLDFDRHFAHYPSRSWAEPLVLRASGDDLPVKHLAWLARHAGLPWGAVERLYDAARHDIVEVDRDDGQRASCAAFLLKHGILRLAKENTDG